MNADDLDELTAKWFQETSSVNIDGAIKATQAHAYQLGLKRGQANCAELAAALKALYDLPDYDGTVVTSTVRRNTKQMARAAISKFQGENHE